MKAPRVYGDHPFFHGVTWPQASVSFGATAQAAAIDLSKRLGR